MILEEARSALGEDREADAADVVQELFAKMMERRLRFPEGPQAGVAILWMKRMVRVIAEG